MALQFKSYQQIVGDMLRKLMSVTGLNDANKGSVLTTLLEAAAQEDFAQYGALIELLDNFSLDSTSGADLEKRASEFGLERQESTAASGFVTITDSTVTKISTGVYIGSSPPIAGDTVINVNDAADITFPGSIYIGRGTANFEGPLALSGAPTDNGSYWTIPLSTPLAKNHNLNETVILAQGGDRVISTGTVVKVPSNNVSDEVTFKVANTQILADGEDTLNNVLVFASLPGSTGNVPLRAITQFESIPFNGAEVTNLSPFSNARDLESDQELRDRIKDHIQSLSRGTATAIVSGVVGVTDSSDNKRVASASLIEPTEVTDVAELFIDDGTGFEPSYAGQGQEDVIIDAVGTEQFLQLGNFPVVKAQVEATEDQPYSLVNGSTLTVRVNDEEETITFLTSDFSNEESAQAIEVAEAINNRATLFEARTTGEQKRVVVFAKTLNNEKIQVVGGTANDSLLFPTEPVYTIKLYKNDVLLSKDGETAFVESASFSSWSAISPLSTFNIQVDGKTIQYLRLGDNTLEMSVDGVNYVAVSGTTFSDLGTSIVNASVEQWVQILDQIIIGAEVTVNGDKIKITSNQESTLDSTIQILDLGTAGNLIGPQGWDTDLSQGKGSDFTLNRFNGQIELAEQLVEGDTITAGTQNTRGNLVSSAPTGGTFDLSLDDGRIPQMFVVVDGTVTVRTVNAQSGDTITVAASGSRWRYTCDAAAFTDMAVGDYVLVQNQTAGAWIGAGNTGLFRVEVLDSSGFYFEVANPNGVAGGPASVDDNSDIQAFSSTKPPQKVLFTVGVNTSSDIGDTLNAILVGATAEVQDDGSIKLSTNNYSDSEGSIIIAAAAGNAGNLGFPEEVSASITPHTASLRSLSEIGFRVADGFGSLTLADTSDPYTSINDTTRSFNSDGITEPNQWVKIQSKVNEDVKGIIRSISGANDLLLRDNSPSLVSIDFLGPTNVGDLYQQYRTFDLEDTDNLVVVMDDDEVNKTHNVPLSRRGRISSIADPTTFDGLDMDANVSGTSFGDTLWSGYDFADYKIWFKAHNLLDPTNDKNAIIYRAKKFGPSGEKIRITYVYSVSPDRDLSATLTHSGDYITISVILGTDPSVATTQDGTTQFNITTPSGTTTRYTYASGTNPGFGAVSVGEIVTFSSPNFSSGNNGTFKISATDNSTYIEVLNSSGVVETKTLGNSAAMVIFPLAGDTGTDIVSLVNDTSPINEVLEAILTPEDPAGTLNDGSGTIDYSTADDPAILSQYIQLVDSENWIRSFSNPTSPQFTLKQSLSFISVGGIYELATAPVYGSSDLGEPFRLIPTTAKNVADHLANPSITSLSLDATIDRSNGGEEVQISSLLVGSQGQVYISGGLGNSNLMTVKGNAAPSGSYLRVPVLTAAAGGFHTSQLIKIANQFASKKVTTFNASTIVTVSNIGASTQRYTLNKRTITADNIAITSPSTNVARLTAGSGTFSGVQVHDELSIDRAGGSAFDQYNKGTFPIIAVDAGGTYIDIINPDLVTQAGPISVGADFTVAVPFFTDWPKELAPDTEIRVEKLSQGLARYRWTGTGTDPNFLTNGLRVDDIIDVAGTVFTQANKGRFRVVGVTDDFVEVINESAVEETITPSESILSDANLGDSVTITAADPNGLSTYTLTATSWNLVPAPGSKIYIPAGSPFAAQHEGIFKVMSSTTNSITVINPSATGEGPTDLLPIAAASLLFMQVEDTFRFFTVDSAEGGDTLSVGSLATAWFDEDNQGQLPIAAVGRDSSFNHYVEVTSSTFTAEAISLGSNVTSFYILEGDPFETYRQIDNIVVDPSDTTKQIVYFTPTTHANRITVSAGSQITSLNKLGFSEIPQTGIDGYKYWTGLLRRVQRTIDGFDSDLVTFPGIKAAGVQVEVKPPLLERVSIGVDVRTSSGTPISILIDSIKSAILSYVASLKVGQDVILSQIVKRVQEVPGVEAVRITDPAPVNDEAPERIVIQDNEKAIAFEDDITVG